MLKVLALKYLQKRNKNEKIKRIFNIFSKPCNMIYPIKYEINHYKEVINIWKSYKREKKIYNNDFLIKDIFDFHLSNTNHVILFYSKNNKNALLMSKIDNEYINLIIPAYSLRNKGVSIISTFTEGT